MVAADNSRTSSLLLATELLIYAIAWSAALFGIAQMHAVPVLAITATYVGFHVYENRVRGHCLLSADSTAMPGALAVLALAYFTHAWLWGTPLEFGPTLASWTVATIGGHVLAIAWCATWSGIAGLVSKTVLTLRR